MNVPGPPPGGCNSDERVEPPINRFIGGEPIDPARPELGLRLEVGEHLVGRGDTLHGGVLPLLLDAAAFRALHPQLEPDEDAVSHDLHFSLVRSVTVGQTVELVGRVVRRGRSVAFIDAVATVDGEVVVTGRITKTIVRRDAGSTGSWTRRVD